MHRAVKHVARGDQTSSQPKSYRQPAANLHGRKGSGAAPVALSARVGSEIVAGGSLELLQRVVEQQDKEIRAMRGESKSAAAQSSLVSSLEERLRRAEASEMAATHRFKRLEDQMALAATAARQRQTQVDSELQNIQRTLVAANQQMSDAAGQRRDLHSDVEGVHDKLGHCGMVLGLTRL